MKVEKQNEALTEIDEYGYDFSSGMVWRTVYHGDYYNDRNILARLVRGLSDEERIKYSKILRGTNHFRGWKNISDGDNRTPDQIKEALLKAVGKWEPERHGVTSSDLTEKEYKDVIEWKEENGV